jgi:predicted dehydrogenase
MDIPKIAVLGLNFGWKYVDVLLKTDMAKLVAVSDKNQSLLSSERAKMVSEAAYFTDYVQLLNEMDGKLDGIIAALPNDLHLPVVEEAAKRGIHVLVEKPIAPNVPDAEKIAAIADNAKIKVLVGHHRRFSAKVNCVKKVIDEGRLGRIVGATLLWAAKKSDEYFEKPWRIKEGTGGPLLINGIHFIDDLRYLVGQIDRVQAYVTNVFRGNDVEDTGSINVIFKSGAVASIFFTDISPGMRFYEANVQEDPRFHPSNYDSYFFFGDKASIAFPSLEMLSYDPAYGDGWRRPFQKYTFPVERVDPMEEEVKHFLEVVTGKAEPRTPAPDATENLRVIDAIKTSSRTGKTVYL